MNPYWLWTQTTAKCCGAKYQAGLGFSLILFVVQLPIFTAGIVLIPFVFPS